MKHKPIFSLLVITASLIFGCSPDLSDDPIPFVPFSPIQINANLPQYQSLNASGFTYVGGGVRGIILYRPSPGSYVAYERNCSYHPNEACATVEMHSSTLYMIDPCCGSSFDLRTGNPAGGPAWRPLRQYETIVSGSQITITDVIVN